MATSFLRRSGELLLVVMLPDGTPGTIRVDATDVFGEAPPPVGPATTLSVEGMRRFRVTLDALPPRTEPPKRRGRPRPWKVVRHNHGIDPFQGLEWVYSAHTTELAARRARDSARAIMVRASGYETAARWSWSVVNDPAGLLVNRSVREDNASVET